MNRYDGNHRYNCSLCGRFVYSRFIITPDMEPVCEVCTFDADEVVE